MIVSNDMLDEPDNTCANVQTAALEHSSYCTDHQSPSLGCAITGTAGRGGSEWPALGIADMIQTRFLFCRVFDPFSG